MKIGWTMLLTSLSALSILAQQPAPQPSVSTAQQPITTLQATARIVVLDVVVNDGHGHPVKDLKASDFRLSEDDIPQTLASFVEHDSDPVPPAPAQPDLPPNTFAVQPPVTGNGVRSVIVLGNTAWHDAPYVRDQIREYLQANPVTMPMAIFRLDTLGLHLVQGFTADRAVLLQAAGSKRILPLRSFDPPDAGFRRGSLSLRNYLAKIPGRVNLIWFSTGTAGEHSFPDITTFVRDANNGSTQILQLSRVALYAIDAGGLKASAPEPGMKDIFASGFASASLNNAHLDDIASQTGGRGFYNTNGFKQAIAEVVDTTTHYYTLSYSPTNTNWNGAFRKIHIDVPGYSVPLGFSWEKFFGIYDEHKVQYRSGYNARINPGPYPRGRPLSPANSAPGIVLGSADGANPNRQRLTPVSAARPVQQPPSPMQLAMEFSSLTPTDIHFTVGITPSEQVVRPAKDAPLPNDVYLTAPFKSSPYRAIRIHYRIARSDLQFQQTSKGTYTDDLQFVAVLYRDDGLLANSITFATHLEISPGTYARIESAPIAYDQTIAMPTTGVFFLRAGVHEIPTGHIGALEIPAEAIQLPSATR
jgi:VWFA-related protein